MFTGIIEQVGTIARVQHRPTGSRLTVRVEDARALRLGESIAVNGACLTVAEIDAEGWSADVSIETLRRTTLGGLQVGDPVHIERALRVGDRLGGHFVQGHVDEIGMIRSLTPAGDGMSLLVDVSDRSRHYLAQKGSIAVDGVSLTIASLTVAGFSVALVPFTLKKTLFARRRAGDRVNLEFDVLVKYVERLLTRGRAESQATNETPPIDIGFLRQHGFG